MAFAAAFFVPLPRVAISRIFCNIGAFSLYKNPPLRYIMRDGSFSISY